MQKTKRALIQTISWALIWMVLWLTQDGNERFIIDNIAAFLFQILLITILIWYVAPKLLFQRKYFIFVLVSILIVGISAYLSSNILSGPPPFRGPRGRGPRAPLPSKFFVQLLLIGVSYIIATLLETFLFAQRKEEETIRNKNENLQTELKLLKSQINPHFLFNALNNIYALSTMDSTKTQESISYLSDMLRYVLYECDKAFVPLVSEIQYIENYIKLFSLKSSRKYPIHTNFNIPGFGVTIAPMLFIPFVENALKHGYIEKGGDSYIKISVEATNDTIDFIIENSFPDHAVQKDKVGGIGIENVKKRLAILYPNKHQLYIDDANGIFTVKLSLNPGIHV